MCTRVGKIRFLFTHSLFPFSLTPIHFLFSPFHFISHQQLSLPHFLSLKQQQQLLPSSIFFSTVHHHYNLTFLNSHSNSTCKYIISFSTPLEPWISKFHSIIPFHYLNFLDSILTPFLEPPCMCIILSLKSCSWWEAKEDEVNSWFWNLC
jgi:hypothetical protein